MEELYFHSDTAVTYKRKSYPQLHNLKIDILNTTLLIQC